jgi:hypothetical protein
MTVDNQLPDSEQAETGWLKCISSHSDFCVPNMDHGS